MQVVYVVAKNLQDNNSPYTLSIWVDEPEADKEAARLNNEALENSHSKIQFINPYEVYTVELNVSSDSPVY